MSDDAEARRMLDDVMRTFGDVFEQAERGDVSYTLPLTLGEASEGCARDVTLVRYDPCARCDGGGGARDAVTFPCRSCDGSGVGHRTEHGVALPTPCMDCRGRGHQWSAVCPACAGRGTSTSSETVRVTVPGGVQHGQQLRITGKGALRGERRGDAYLAITVGEHPRIRRAGDDLHLRAHVPRRVAKRGGAIELDLPSGPRSIEIAPGVRSGDEQVIAGWGAVKLGSPTLPIAKADQPYRSIDPREHRGDLVVTFEVEGEPLPDEKLTADERERARSDRAFMIGAAVGLCLVATAIAYSMLVP